MGVSVLVSVLVRRQAFILSGGCLRFFFKWWVSPLFRFFKWWVSPLFSPLFSIPRAGLEPAR